MARSFSKPNRLHVMNELNVTPMLDLCFVLLIIFMISTPVLEQTTAVNLPKADKGAGKTPDAKTQYRIVSIDRDGVLLRPASRDPGPARGRVRGDRGPP